MDHQRMENQDEQVLKWMLGQIKRARQRKKRLDDRLMEINAEHFAPIGGIGYDLLPRSSGVGNGAASILFKLAEIEERIYAQKEEIEKCICRVMDILSYLPQDDIGREICEMLHIDGMKWNDIADAIPMSRSQCNVNYNNAIRTLLTFPRIQKMVENNREAYDMWCYQQEEARRKRSKK